jgi:ABC-type branched-subunit amino acid transport system substrate-binding protein
MLAVVPAGSSQINGGAVPGVFNLAVPRTSLLPQLEDWLTPHEYRRAGILTPNDPWGEVHNDLFTRAVKQVGGSVVAAERYDYRIDAGIFRAILLKAKMSSPDVLLA